MTEEQAANHSSITGEELAALMERLEMDVEIADGDFVRSAVLLMPVLGADGQTALSVTRSANLSWYDEVALVHAWRVIVESTMIRFKQEG